MKQVNLKEILLNAFIQYKADYPENRLSKVYTIEQFQNATEILTVGMNAMQEACNQTVDLCAENAMVVDSDVPDNPMKCILSHSNLGVILHRHSILLYS